MNKFSALTIAVGFLLGSISLGAAAAAEDEQVVRTQSISDSLHLLQGRGGNVVASVGLDGVLLVDNDYADLGEAYAAVIQTLTNSEIAPGFIVNTHWHGDHTGNNEFWGYRGAVMVAHQNVRARMSTRQEITALDMVVEPSPVIALPLVTFEDSIALHFNDNDVEIQHYPNGHTDGDSVVFYSQDNVLHAGDLFFKDRFPFVDLSSGGSVDGYMRNVETLLGRIDDATVVVPGHGSLAMRADLERYLAMMKQTTETVRAALASGKSVEEIVTAGLGDEWDDWGQGFISEEQWIRTVAADS